MKRNIKGQVCIITGASSGIGSASAIFTEFEMGNGRTEAQMKAIQETTLSSADLAEVVVYIFTRRKGTRIMEMYLAGMQGK